jgi:hypothetical protein
MTDEDLAGWDQDANICENRSSFMYLEAQDYLSLRERLRLAEGALRKIYNYRSDAPDWNMVMAIAGDIVDPQVLCHEGNSLWNDPE